MTFKERLAEERPDCIGEHHWGGCAGCPGSHWREYEYINCGHCIGGPSKTNCDECWNQEIPEITTNNTIKEKDEMAEKVLMSAEDRIKSALDEIKDLKNEIARLEKYKHYDETAEQTKAMYDSYIAHGFTEAQAWKLLCIVMKGAIDNLQIR